jgi:oxaloacetate decarboxylase alpha subunit
MVTKEFKALVRGEYGTTPVEIDPAFRKQIIGDAEAITCRPADKIAPELDTLREKIKPYAEQEEDVLSYALFEQVATKFFENRKNKKYQLDATNADKELGIHSV